MTTELADRGPDHHGAATIPDPLGTLSARESQVLSEASRGLTNEQVAARLDVTVHAVKFHLAGIYRKLGVSNRTEAAGVYLRATALGGDGGK